MSKKIAVVHCSPRADGNSSMLADEFIRGAEEAGNRVVRMEAGRADIHGCKACEHCLSHEGSCVQQDDMQAFYPDLRDADILVFATPMYFYNLPAQMRAFEDRTFCQAGKPFAIKQTALLLCFEDKDASTADAAIGTFRQCASYCKREVIGEVIVNGVYERGAIAGNPGLERAYRLGLGIA